MKKTKRILAGVLGMGLIAALLLFTNAFLGNPVSKALAKRAAQTYIDTTYAPLGLELQSCGYNFKFGAYSVFVQSPTSQDTGFAIRVDSFGNVVGDDYEYEVANHFTTFRRLDSELRAFAQEKLAGHLPYVLDHIALQFISEADLLALEQDIALDVKNPPQPLEMTVTLFSEELSYEKIAEVAKTLEMLLHMEEIPVESYSVRLLPMENRPEKGGVAVSWVNSMEIAEFPAEQLGAENLPQAMERHRIEQTAQWDSEKK